MPLLLPRSVAEERDRINAERRSQTFAGYAEQWTRELRKVDRDLEIVRASDFPEDPDLTPGGWYLLKRIPGTVDELFELPQPPGPWIYDWLLARDMWNPSVYRSREKARERYKAAQARARDLEAEQRQDAMREAISAASRIRDDRGMSSRSDLKLPPGIAKERREKLTKEGIKAK